jgi:hypothetical protein
MQLEFSPPSSPEALSRGETPRDAADHFVVVALRADVTVKALSLGVVPCITN